MIGLAQLAQARRVAPHARAERAAIWPDALGSIDGLRAPTPTGEHAARELQVVRLRRSRGDLTPRAKRDAILAAVRTELGIRAFSGSGSEAYLEEAVRRPRRRTAAGRALARRASLMFEVHPTLDLERLRARAAVVATVARDVLG